MRKVTIEVIPHDQQAYSTTGDWRWNGDELNIYVSNMGDWRYNMLVAVHELSEVMLCKHHGVSQESVDKFDIQYEKDRPDGDLSEPGDDPRAPYASEHCLATAVERLLAPSLDVKWKEYEDANNALY